MDGKPGWMTIRYAFCWVRANKTHLDTLDRQTYLRWPSNYNENTYAFSPVIGDRT